MSSREHYIINTFFLSLHAVFHHYINIEHEATFFITSSATFFQKSVPFSVCAVNSSYKVEYYESEDGLNWIFIDYADIPQYIHYNGANRNCWHIDVQKTWLGRKYYALITYASGAGGATPSYLFWVKVMMVYTGQFTMNLYFRQLLEHGSPHTFTEAR